MAKIIDFNVDKQSCYRFARDAYNKENYLLAVQNISEGLLLCDDGKDDFRLKLYELLSNIYEETENYDMKKQCFIKQFYPKYKDTYCFSFNKDLYFEDDLSEEVYYNELNDCNEILREIEVRNYTVAFGKIMSNNLTETEWQRIIDAIKSAYKCDGSFSIEQYFVPAVTLLAKLIDKSGLIWIMLKGAGALHDLAVDGVDVFIDSTDDPYLLHRLAEVYYEFAEFEAAKIIYQSLIEYNSLDGKTLFHLSACNFALSDGKEGDKYFAKFKSMFLSVDVPIEMYDEFFHSEYKTAVCSYPYLPESFTYNAAKNIINGEEIKNIDYIDVTKSLPFLKKISQLIAVMEEKSAFNFLELLKDNKNEIGKGYNLILNMSLMYVPIKDSVKKRIFEMLSENGYSGNAYVVLSDKIVQTCLISLPENSVKGDNKKTIKNNKYRNIYYMFMNNMPFLEGYIPLKLTILKNVIIKFEEKEMDFEENRYYEICTEIIDEYVKRAKLNINIEPVKNWLGCYNNVAKYFK